MEVCIKESYHRRIGISTVCSPMVRSILPKWRDSVSLQVVRLGIFPSGETRYLYKWRDCDSLRAGFAGCSLAQRLRALVVCIFSRFLKREKIKVATSVCTGGSNIPPAYCDLIFESHPLNAKSRDGKSHLCFLCGEGIG